MCSSLVVNQSQLTVHHCQQHSAAGPAWCSHDFATVADVGDAGADGADGSDVAASIAGVVVDGGRDDDDATDDEVGCVDTAAADVSDDNDLNAYDGVDVDDYDAAADGDDNNNNYGDDDNIEGTQTYETQIRERLHHRFL